VSPKESDQTGTADISAAMVLLMMVHLMDKLECGIFIDGLGHLVATLKNKLSNVVNSSLT
jgi:hypothetical protein